MDGKIFHSCVVILAVVLSLFAISQLTMSATAPSKVTYRLKYRIGSTKTNDVYKLGDFNITIDELNTVNTQYSSNLSHGYVCTHDFTQYPDGISVALINSGDKRRASFVNFSSNQTSVDVNYTIELKQDIQNGQALLAYTKDDCDNIDGKMYIVENQDLPSKPFSPFSLGASERLMQLRLSYERIVINGSEWFDSGSNKICVEHLSTTQGNLPVIGVYKC